MEKHHNNEQIWACFISNWSLECCKCDGIEKTCIFTTCLDHLSFRYLNMNLFWWEPWYPYLFSLQQKKKAKRKASSSYLKWLGDEKQGYFFEWPYQCHEDMSRLPAPSPQQASSQLPHVPTLIWDKRVSLHCPRSLSPSYLNILFHTSR